MKHFIRETFYLFLLIPLALIIAPLVMLLGWFEEEEDAYADYF